MQSFISEEIATNLLSGRQISKALEDNFNKSFNQDFAIVPVRILPGIQLKFWMQKGGSPDT